MGREGIFILVIILTMAILSQSLLNLCWAVFVWLALDHQAVGTVSVVGKGLASGWPP